MTSATISVVSFLLKCLRQQRKVPLLELSNNDKAKIDRLRRQLKHVSLGSKEAQNLKNAIKKVKGRAKDR
jgi:hypothetical protein